MKKSKRLKAGDLPVGVWAAMGLLNFFAVAMIVPMLPVGMYLFIGLVSLFGAVPDYPMMALPILTMILVVLLIMVEGTMWLARYLRAIHFRGDPSRAPRVPRINVRKKALPLLYFVVCLAMFALACVIRSWAWNVTWATMGGGCGFLIYLIHGRRSD